MARAVWGIDVSKYSIKAVRIDAGGAGLTLTRSDVIPYGNETGEASNLDDDVRTALEDMKNRLHFGSDRIVISLPGHSTFNRLIKLPPVDDAKIPEVVKYEAQSQIPFNIDEVIWDYQFVERVYGPGEEKEVILFAIKRDIVEQFLKNIEHLGLNIDAVQFAPVALYNFLVKDQDVGTTAVALDMGADNTDLIIIDGPKFWIRNLPITGNDITKALQKAFNIPFDEAEKLKLKAPQSQQAQKIFNAVQPVLRDLVGEVHRSIGYYKSISKTIKFDKVVLLGNATKTLNFQKFVSQSLQMPASRIAKLNHIQVGGSVDQAQLNEDLGTLGTAVGLALQGHEEAKNRINLLPPVFLKKKELKKKQPYIIGIAAALYLLVFVIGWTWNSELQQVSATVTDAKNVNRDYDVQKGEFDRVQKDVQKYSGPLDKLVSISYERDMILKVMNLVNPNIPPNGRREGVREEDKMWILDWQFEELPRKAEAVDPKQRLYVPDKFLKVTIEGVIPRGGRQDRTQARKWIAARLLGVDVGTGARSREAKASVATDFGLIDGDPDMSWSVVPEETSVLMPKRDAVEVEEDPEKRPFYRFAVTLHIPMNPDVRRQILEARAEKAKAAAEPPKK